ncbi:MAG TPA: aromatic ring-hydroxylating dioxygenase subunit alpha [Ramlibacter sp.]|nr:aromatic ring-hydroxylating dioxygenase subunit alpha [Ramlibacter sp.]
MQPDEQSMALARRALAHLRNRSTDQADGMLEMPISAYTDPERYQREVDRLFRHLPLALALSIELPAPRSWRAMTILDVPVLLVRGDDGVARAFINVCRHRGAKLVATGSGTAQRFVCPYHAWQYDLQGRLKGIYGADTFGEVGPATHSLTELPCAERHGLVWVCLTPGETFEIDPWLGEFGTQLDTLKLGGWHLYDQRELPGPGWKVAWDGYLEGYHHNLVHPDTVGKYTIGNLTLHDTWGPHQRIVFGRRTLEQLGKQPESDWEPDLHIRRIHLGFPNLAISGVTGDHCLVSQVFPGPTPATTITRQTVLAARKPETEEQRQVTATFSDLVLRAVRDEDYVIGFGIQEGLHSGGNKSVVFGRNEPAVQHFHKMVAAYAPAAD